jgi:hypothetical protein
MLEGENEDGIAEIVEADAIVANAEAELGRFDILKAFHIAFASGEITSNDMQNTKCGSLVDSAEVGLGLVSSGNLLGHGYWPGAWGSSGVRPMRAKSSPVSPNSANTSSWGMGSLFFNQALESATARVSSSLIGSSSKGALAKLRATGSSIIFKRPTTAETWPGAMESINS